RDFLLGHRLIIKKAVSSLDDFQLSSVQFTKMAVKSFFLLLLLYGIDWRFLVGLQQICYLKGLSVLICSDRIEERYILLHFLLRSQIHEYFIFNTPGRICRKLRLTIECEAVHGFHEPDCTDGNIIVQLFVFWMEFFYDMSDK